jgi:hypothetical protein
MESDRRDDLRAQLHEVERGEAAPWVTQTAQPRWLPVAFGAVAAFITVAIGTFEGSSRTSALGAVVVLELGYIHWERRRRGAWPTGRAPSELGRTLVACVLALVVVVLGTWWVAASVGVWPAAAVSAVATWLVLTWYGAAYEAAARRVRSRLT